METAERVRPSWPPESSDLECRAQFAYSCYWAYNSSMSGVGPESIVFYQPTDSDRYDTKVDKGARRVRCRYPSSVPHICCAQRRACRTENSAAIR
jgi:hypothetical protein